MSVKSKSASFPQRFTIAGAAVGNGTHVVSGSVAPVLVTGASWTLKIESQGLGGTWNPSAMRFKTPTLASGLISVDIESDDTGGDKDFNDLILTCTMPDTGSDFVVYGHATAYSGSCWFNPCWWQLIAIESPWQLAVALKNPIAKAAIEQLYPEHVLPGPKNPPDPSPLRTFTPLLLPTPRSAAIPPRSFQIARSTPEGVVRQFSSAKTPSQSSHVLDASLVSKLGSLVDNVKLLCTTTTLGNYGLRFQEYDRTSAELGGCGYTGTGPREDLGTTATDVFGNYLFRFSRSLADVVNEILTDVAPGENAVVQALPDLIVQVLGAGLVPAAETGCYFNVPSLKRIDICVPATNIVLPSSCVDDKILTFIGKISLTSNSNSLDGTGRITAHSTAGSPPTIDCGVWLGNLDLWGCFGNSTVASYTLRWRPVGSGTAGWQFHAATETREAVGGTAKKIGPFFDVALAVPDDGVSGKVSRPRYLNAEEDGTIVQPGAYLKVTLGSGAFATGSYDVRIDAFNAAGDWLEEEHLVLYVDNVWPSVSISDIVLAGVPVNISGVGCTLQTLAPAELSADMDVRFKVDQTSGAILSYGLAISRCNEGSAWPTSYVSGGEPSFAWVLDTSVNCETPPNFRRGTIEDPANDGFGFVTTTLSPDSPWLGATENFTILRATITYAWRATTGYVNASAQTYGPLVWGIQK